MDDYDEDLSQNAFYKSLQSSCSQLYDTATENRWMICVPQSSVVTQYSYTEKDFENHILIPVHDEPNHFTTASNKRVSIQDNNISTGTGFPEMRKVPVLFEETFFNKNDESYYVLCISVPLEGGPADLAQNTPVVMIKNLDDCKDMLWGHTGNVRTQKQLDDIISYFNASSSRLEGQTVRQHMDATNAMFTKAMQTVLRDTYLKKMARQSKSFMDTLKVAVETYIMHQVYVRLFKCISGCLASKDAKLNKTTRNLSELQLRDLGVKQDFCHNVPRARREMTNLNRYSTPIGKLHCIKRVVKTIMTPHKAAARDEDSTALTTDDLLPILVFLVVKSEVPNWWANLTYMTSFRFSKSTNDDEFGFFLASMEAAIEHVGGGELDAIKLGAANPQKMHLSISPSQNSDGMWTRQDSVEFSSIDRFYQHIKDNHVNEVTEMLTRARKRNHGDIVLDLCHPLCSCDRCERLIVRSRNDATLVTVFSRDDHGCTALHIAAQVGTTGMVELLITHGAAVDATDYHGYSPLHSACMKGNQSVALLLLHYKADVNLQDNDGHTPLHLAASNGHEECVKALVYHDQGSTSLQMDTGNDFGNTPLHLAAKWGYVGIVDILLDNGALVDVKNRKKLTPYHYAHNVKVAGLLRKAQETSGIVKPKPLLFSQVPPPRKHPEVSSVGTERPYEPNHKKYHEEYRKVEKLLKSVADGDIEMVKFLMGWTAASDEDEEDGADICARELCHPLCQCDQCKPLQRAQTPSSNGLSVNSANHDGFTPLHVAALHGQNGLVELFLKRGATVNAKNSSQQCSSLHLACQYNQVPVVKTLLQHGARVNARDVRGNTPLHYCSFNGAKSSAEILLQNQANVNQPNHKGNTALHEAARRNYAELVTVLLACGADARYRNRQQLVPAQLSQSSMVARILDSASRRPSLCDQSDDSSRDAASSLLPLSSSSSSLTSLAFPPQSPTLIESPSPSPTLSISFPSKAFSNAHTNGDVPISEEENQIWKQLRHGIVTFDKSRTLKPTITRDRSNPRLDLLLRHQLHIQHFDLNSLRHTQTEDKSSLSVWYDNRRPARADSGSDETDCVDFVKVTPNNEGRHIDHRRFTPTVKDC